MYISERVLNKGLTASSKKKARKTMRPKLETHEFIALGVFAVLMFGMFLGAVS